MVALYTNNASTLLASSITSSATTLTVTTGQGSQFPSPTGSDYFMATLQSITNSNCEIVKCTARSGDVLTIVRAQESTTAYAFNANDVIELRVTAGEMTMYSSVVSGTGTVTITGGTISGLSSPLPVASGGTGSASLTANNVLLGNGTSSVQVVAPNTSGYALRSTGTTWTSQKLGLGMTGEVWHDVTSSRSQGTTYTNSNSYPISVSICFATNNDQDWYLYVNGVQVGHLREHQDFNGGSFSSIVPAGGTYLFTGNYLQVWAELY